MTVLSRSKKAASTEPAYGSAIGPLRRGRRSAGPGAGPEPVAPHDGGDQGAGDGAAAAGSRDRSLRAPRAVRRRDRPLSVSHPCATLSPFASPAFPFVHAWEAFVLIACWSAKGGVGTTVVAASLALSLVHRREAPSGSGSAGALLADLAGDLPAVLGVPEPSGPGLSGWLAAGPDVPADALGRLEVPVGPGLHLLPRGAGPLGTDRVDVLIGLLAADPRVVVADCGRLDVASAPALLAAGSTRSLLVTPGVLPRAAPRRARAHHPVGGGPRQRAGAVARAPRRRAGRRRPGRHRAVARSGRRSCRRRRDPRRPPASRLHAGPAGGGMSAGSAVPRGSVDVAPGTRSRRRSVAAVDARIARSPRSTSAPSTTRPTGGWWPSCRRRRSTVPPSPGSSEASRRCSPLRRWRRRRPGAGPRSRPRRPRSAPERRVGHRGDGERRWPRLGRTRWALGADRHRAARRSRCSHLIERIVAPVGPARRSAVADRRRSSARRLAGERDRAAPGHRRAVPHDPSLLGSADRADRARLTAGGRRCSSGPSRRRCEPRRDRWHRRRARPPCSTPWPA